MIPWHNYNNEAKGEIVVNLNPVVMLVTVFIKIKTKFSVCDFLKTQLHLTYIMYILILKHTHNRLKYLKTANQSVIFRAHDLSVHTEKH